MKEKKHNCQVFTIYEPSKSDKNKDSSDILKLLWVKYLTLVKTPMNATARSSLVALFASTTCSVLSSGEFRNETLASKSPLAISLKSIQKLTKGKRWICFFLFRFFRCLLWTAVTKWRKRGNVKQSKSLDLSTARWHFRLMHDGKAQQDN